MAYHRIVFALPLLIGFACIHFADRAAGVPLPVTDGLVFHVDAEDPLDNGATALPANGAELDTWANKGSLGASADATSSGTARPRWFSSGGPGDRARVTFDGVNDLMTAGSASDWKFLNFDDAGGTFNGSTVFLVYQTGAADPEALYGLVSTGQVGSSSEGFDLFYDDRSGNEDRLRMILSKGVGGSSNIDTPGEQDMLTPQTGSLITSTYQFQAPGDDAEIYVDGLVLESQETMNPPLIDQDPTNTLTIGAVSTPGFFNEGDFSEVLIYNRRLTSDELNKVGEFLERKFDLDTAFEARLVPEPSSCTLLLIGALACCLRGRAGRRSGDR